MILFCRMQYGRFLFRIALCVSQPRLFLLLTSFIFYLLFIIVIKIIESLINIL